MSWEAIQNAERHASPEQFESPVKRSPKPYSGLTPRAYPGLTPMPMLMSQKSRIASAMEQCEPRATPTKRSVSASQAPVSSIPAIPEHLPKSYPGSVNPSQTTSHVIAFFSTEGRRYEPRNLPDTKPPPVVIRSDPKRDTQEMIKDLRALYPHVCNSIFANSSNGHTQWDITWFFDEWDFYVMGPEFLYNVVLTMQRQNEEAVFKIASDWSEANNTHFPWIPNQTLGIEQMFAEHDREKYGDEFCRVCLRMIRNAYVGAFEKCVAEGYLTQSSAQPSLAVARSDSQRCNIPKSRAVSDTIMAAPGIFPPPANNSFLLACQSVSLDSQSTIFNPVYPRGKTMNGNATKSPVLVSRTRDSSNHLQQHFFPRRQFSTGCVSPTLVPLAYQQPQIGSLQHSITSEMVQQPKSQFDANIPFYYEQISDAGPVAIQLSQDILSPRAHGSYHGKKLPSNAEHPSSINVSQEPAVKRGGRKSRVGARRGSISGGNHRQTPSEPSRSSQAPFNALGDPPVQVNYQDCQSRPDMQERVSVADGRKPDSQSGCINRPLKLQVPTGRRSPDETYAKISPAIRKTMIRRHFIGEDIEYLRELCIGGCQKNMSAREICDAIGETAAVDQIRISPDRATATVSFFSTADTRRVLSRFQIPCKGYQLYIEVPRMFQRTGKESEDYAPPASPFETANYSNRRPSHKLYHAAKSPELRKSFHTGFPNAHRPASSRKPQVVKPDNRQYSPQDARSSILPAITEPISSTQKSFSVLQNTWAAVAVGENIDASASTQGWSESLIKREHLNLVSTIEEEDENQVLESSSDSRVPETCREEDESESRDAQSNDSSRLETTTEVYSNDGVIGLNATEKIISSKKRSILQRNDEAEHCQPGQIDNNQIDETKDDEIDETKDDEIDEDKIDEDKIDEDKIDEDKIDGDKCDPDQIAEDQIEQDQLHEDRIDEDQTEKTQDQLEPNGQESSQMTKVEQSQIGLSESEPTTNTTGEVDVFQSTSLTADYKDSNLRSVSYDENQNFAPLSNYINGPDIQEKATNEHLSPQDQCQTARPKDVDSMRSTQDFKYPEESTRTTDLTYSKDDVPQSEQSPSLNTATRMKPITPAINTSRKRSSTGSSSIEPGSPAKSSPSAARHLAREILRAREEGGVVPIEQEQQTKGQRACKQVTQSGVGKARSSPPSVDDRKSSPNASRHHSPSASRDQSNKSSPSPRDLGHWASEHEKARKVNSTLPAGSRKDSWSHELATLKIELEGIEERYSQSYDKYLSRTKTGKKSAKKTLNQLARCHKEKIEELVMLHGRISSEADSQSAAPTTMQNSRAYPAFHQPSAQEILEPSSSPKHGFGARSSSLPALQQRQTVMTPQSTGSTMPSIDSVLVTDELHSMETVAHGSYWIIYPSDDEANPSRPESPIKASSTVVNDESPARTDKAPEQAKAVTSMPKSYASVAARGAPAAPPRPAIGLGITKSNTSGKAENKDALGEWEAPEGPWGQAGLQSTSG